MTQKKIKTFALLASLAGVLLLAGCHKKAAKVTPPPPPAPAPTAPTATLAANPSVILQGQSTVLTWQTSNANEITIAGLGTLLPSGSRSITPTESTTYTLVAKGPGGTKEVSARVTVNAPIAKVTAPPPPSDEDLFGKNVKDVFFDYDKSVIRPDQTSTVQNDAAFLSQHPNIKVLIEGHCDDRGSEEYNIALGTGRAESVKQVLLQHGISAERIKTISYGKEKPFCTQDNEQCWQQNRVDHFVFER
ncbi:MAG: peptidoglycan-associated lipoprotein Pal [Terriglobales bacterium]|jgi:peptidoglycan-associated lipoprotein